MSTPFADRSAYTPYALGLLRMMTALLFMQHGFQKLFAFPDAGHHPGPFVLFSLAGVAGILETFGGLAILLGLWTRRWHSCCQARWPWLISCFISPVGSAFQGAISQS